MNQLREFVLKDVRCFQDPKPATLRPITLLVGENSTGKTTFLGCYRALHGWLSATRWPFVNQVDFNQEPFSMGSWREIVRSRLGRSGRINEFKLGITVGGGSRRSHSHQILFTFLEAGLQPLVSRIRYEFNTGAFIEFERHSPKETILTIPGAKEKIPIPLEDWCWVRDYLSHSREDSSANLRFIDKYLAKTLPQYRAIQPGNRWPAFIPDLQPLLPLAPLRSKPKRTYDPVRETVSSDGEHIPMLMMKLSGTDKHKWSSLQNDLVEFGRASNLFSDIRVRHHGKQMSDPFQLRVKVRSGPPSNIMDVGYGVSQGLPILVDVKTKRNHAFLLQQPEVHLHPRAQAELAELFVKSHKKQDNSFLIETHSDYIVDRVRILVRKKEIDADSVSILYFDPGESGVAIHSLSLDSEGNLHGCPSGYRKFFIRETDRLLGFDD